MVGLDVVDGVLVDGEVWLGVGGGLVGEEGVYDLNGAGDWSFLEGQFHLFYSLNSVPIFGREISEVFDEFLVVFLVEVVTKFALVLAEFLGVMSFVNITGFKRNP